MSNFTVRQGQRYRAVIRLSLLEQLAGNEVIGERLRDAGFIDVEVTGQGAMRRAEATWSKEDASAPLPSQVVEVTEISSA